MSIILGTIFQINIFHLKQNAVPATIAILNGRIKVGLSSDELTLLANNDALKLDLPTISTSSSVHGGKVSKLDMCCIAQCILVRSQFIFHSYSILHVDGISNENC